MLGIRKCEQLPLDMKQISKGPQRSAVMLNHCFCTSAVMLNHRYCTVLRAGYTLVHVMLYVQGCQYPCNKGRCWLGCITQRMSGADTASGPASP
eukprot:125248-Pelagomonas_calceolata.AAC.1